MIHASMDNFVTFLQQQQAEEESRILKMRNGDKPRPLSPIYIELENKTLEALVTYEVMACIQNECYSFRHQLMRTLTWTTMSSTVSL